jgi:hypothetical protein
VSGEATCPYCKEEFEPDDHYESGPYECPECLEVLWLEVEYDISFDASCIEGEHLFVKNEAASVTHKQTVLICDRCGACDLPDMRNEVKSRAKSQLGTN